jgi:hypothetical protein
MESVLKFLSDLLTDKFGLESVKEKALELYIDSSGSISEDSLRRFLTEINNIQEGVYVIPIPFPITGNTVHISSQNYDIVKTLLYAEKKIQAIKHLRANSLVDGDPSKGGPGLKEAKDIVEHICL